MYTTSIFALKQRLSGQAWPAGPAGPEASTSKTNKDNGDDKAKKPKQMTERQRLKAEKRKQRGGGGGGPSLKLTSKGVEGGDYGVLPLIQSQAQSSRVWTRVGELSEGQSVLIRGRVAVMRSSGNKMCFLTIRDGQHTVQATFHAGADKDKRAMAKWINSLKPETLIDVEGDVKPPPPDQAAINTATMSSVELHIMRLFVVSAPTEEPPFSLADASQQEEEGKEFSKVLQDTRLDNRFYDLRTPANTAIMKVQAAVCTYFREYLMSKGFFEIHTPKTIAGASEGGAEVFKFDYFGREACLAQSPQLYKQMAICSDFDRVFEIGPVFRAENSNSARHMTEFVGLDFEMEIKEHYYEVLDMLEGLFLHIFDALNERNQSEIAAVRQQYPFKDLRYRHTDGKVLRLHWNEAMDMLKADGRSPDVEGDIHGEDETRLGQLVAEKYSVDFYFLDKYPEAARPFYTMLNPHNPKETNSYDIFIRAEEITSGAQRIHDAGMLKTRAEAKGIPPESIQSYIDSFKLGAKPHGGAGISLERVTKLFLGLNNIRKASMYPRDPARITP